MVFRKLNFIPSISASPWHLEHEITLLMLTKENGYQYGGWLLWPIREVFCSNLLRGNSYPHSGPSRRYSGFLSYYQVSVWNETHPPYLTIVIRS
jgi:hypothetical protein